MTKSEEDLFHAVKTSNLSEIQRLVESGADVNIKDSVGWTPLMYATENDDKKIAKKLLELGAYLDIRNDDGETALMQAAYNNSKNVGKLLVLKGANLEKRDIFGRTANDIACEMFGAKKGDFFSPNRLYINIFIAIENSINSILPGNIISTDNIRKFLNNKGYEDIELDHFLQKKTYFSKFLNHIKHLNPYEEKVFFEDIIYNMNFCEEKTVREFNLLLKQKYKYELENDKIINILSDSQLLRYDKNTKIYRRIPSDDEVFIFFEELFSETGTGPIMSISKLNELFEGKFHFKLSFDALYYKIKQNKRIDYLTKTIVKIPTVDEVNSFLKDFLAAHKERYIKKLSFRDEFYKKFNINLDFDYIKNVWLTNNFQDISIYVFDDCFFIGISQKQLEDFYYRLLSSTTELKYISYSEIREKISQKFRTEYRFDDFVNCYKTILVDVINKRMEYSDLIIKLLDDGSLVIYSNTYIYDDIENKMLNLPVCFQSPQEQKYIAYYGCLKEYLDERGLDFREKNKDKDCYILTINKEKTDRLNEEVAKYLRISFLRKKIGLLISIKELKNNFEEKYDLIITDDILTKSIDIANNDLIDIRIIKCDNEYLRSDFKTVIDDAIISDDKQICVICGKPISLNSIKQHILDLHTTDKENCSILTEKENGDFYCHHCNEILRLREVSYHIIVQHINCDCWNF